MDKSGSNLLNPKHDHAITEENTTLYYLVEGQKKKVYDESKNFPKGFFITDETGSYEMALFPNIVTGKKTASTLVTFENYPTDTLKVEYVQSDKVTALTKVWYNDQLKWDTNSGKRIIQVTKSIPE